MKRHTRVFFAPTRWQLRNQMEECIEILENAFPDVICNAGTFCDRVNYVTAEMKVIGVTGIEADAAIMDYIDRIS